MSFLKRKIILTFEYGTGDDGQGNPTSINTAELSGLRVSCSTVIAGGIGMGQCNLRIFGMNLSLMNELSTLGKLPTVYRRNIITVTAGDDVNGMYQIYKGTITAAWVDFTGMPAVSLNVTGAAGFIEALTPIPASSYPTAVNVAVAMKSLADQMHLAFENRSDVATIIPKSYFPGTGREQARRCAEAAGINWVIDNGTLAIWPNGEARKGNSIPLISPETGMVGYPTFTSMGIIVKTLFNPSPVYGQGVQIQSELKPACGQWNIITLSHEVDAELPGGNWFTTMQLGAPGYVIAA